VTARQQSTQEQNKAVLRNLAEAFSKADINGLEDLYSPNVVYHGTGNLANADRKTFLDFIASCLSGFPDTKMTVDDLLADGDKVIYRLTVRGTHKGEFMGISATNKSVAIRSIGIARISGGKIVEEWENFDEMGMMQQLGSIPAG